ncbi:MAG: peptide-methionine (S)-S-oxide reductase MsrA [Candidatus Portnoybacteria bacterium]|nr:peptide-methionine (S)-S-oxide reductase MsrA [Candidatus Portnoybacteria bacterium]
MKNELEKATFAAGCFWQVQNIFDRIPGVISSVVGYIGGVGIPDYETAEAKGYAETIEISFDPKIINYGELLKVFWKEHDPTSLNQQGADIGKRYRSAIFYHNVKQKRQALKSKEKLQEITKRLIVTEIVFAEKFYPAEKYHQKYIVKKNHYFLTKI